MSEPVKVLSFGGGVQSVCLHLMQHTGEIDAADYSVFADTGWEPDGCYSYMEKMQELGLGKIDIVNNGSIREDLLAAGRGERKFTSIPGFTDEGGKPHMIPRQCTRDYKITPVRRFCAQKLRERGLKKKPGAVQLWLGISTDEALRMKPSQVKYVTHRFPLIEKKMSRNDCLEWLRSKGYEIPGKSACIGCPFRNVENWVGLTPRERSDVVLVDEVIRSIGRLRGDFYLNRKLKPMKQFFSELPTIEQLSQESQKFRNDFNNECEGMCGL